MTLSIQIFTMEPAFAGEKLYDADHQGRFLALFRHPVDRAVSMFCECNIFDISSFFIKSVLLLHLECYLLFFTLFTFFPSRVYCPLCLCIFNQDYLQSATWERTYRPEWASMSVLEWAALPNSETDYMVHKLVNKPYSEKVTETDLIIAKELVRQRFVVGLMNEMEESVRRFNIALGVDTENNERNKQCMKEFFGEKKEEDTTPAEQAGGEKTLANTDNKNSNKHPKVCSLLLRLRCIQWLIPYHIILITWLLQFEPSSPEYKAIAERNPLDMILYQYIEKLFDEQKEIIDHYYTRDDDSIINPEDETTQDAVVEAEASVEEEVEVEKDEHQDPQDDEPLLPIEANRNLVNVGQSFDKSPSITPFFWHVPKCGGTSLQRLYWCMGMSIANEVGGNPKFAAAVDRSKLQAFKPWTDNPGRVVNVDVSTHQGIMDASRRGFLGDAEQAEVDFISTSEFHFAYTMLYSPEHRARMFALFRWVDYD